MKKRDSISTDCSDRPTRAKAAHHSRLLSRATISRFLFQPLVRVVMHADLQNLSILFCAINTFSSFKILKMKIQYPKCFESTRWICFSFGILHGICKLHRLWPRIFFEICLLSDVTALGNDMVCSINRFWAVKPLHRSLFSRNVQRVRLGFLFALPHTSGKLIKAFFSPDRQQEIKKVLHKI